MITGHVNAAREAILPLTLRGAGGAQFIFEKTHLRIRLRWGRSIVVELATGSLVNPPANGAGKK